jgi:hypothetical protein
MKNYTSLKHMVTAAVLLFAINLNAQDSSYTKSKSSVPSFEMGQGLNFKFNNGDYQFKIGGMIQPFVGYQKDSTNDPNYYLNSRRTFFNFGGKAVKEKLEFLVQTDFSLATPLLDAWVSYAPIENLKFTFGQQLTFTNNKEMAIMEPQLQFIERSLLSTQYSSLGREFGLFIESNFNLGNVLIVPQAAVTSGDGRNSFGINGLDYDLGGLKYGGRLDVYPLGNFSEGNNKLIADIKKEEKPKLALGVAGSYNTGSSHSEGEGHGTFLLYDANGKNQLPDYRKLYYDVLFKYNGFSFLGEYGIATAKVMEGTYFDVTALDELKPTEISQLLALGTGFNTQIGYVYNKKYGIDFRYATVAPEFTNAGSIVKNRNEITLGLTKYVNENNLKINASITQLNFESKSSLIGAFYVQMIF